MNESWREFAECKGMDTRIFVPSKEGVKGRPCNSDYDVARRICAECKVRLHCLNFALNEGFNEYGMYGGVTPKARQKMARVRKQVQQA